MIELRDYQIDIRNKIYESMKNGYHRPLVAAPCGSGKTILFCDIAARTQAKNKKVIILIHRIELMEQTLRTFLDSHVPLKTIEVYMVITYANRLVDHKKPDLIITDEAHFSMANTWRKIYNHFPDVYVIGFTGSPVRLDGKPLGDVYDCLIETISIKELTRLGYLAPYRYFAPAVADLSALKKKGSDYDQDQAAEILMQRAVYGDVLRTYHELAEGKKTVIYCTTVKHSQAIAEEFRLAGYRSEHIDGTTPVNERTDIVNRFRSGETMILSNCDIVSCGFDLPDIECCIMLRPTASVALFVQQSGRALRPLEGKTAIILDHVNNVGRFGLPDDPRQWSLDSVIKPTDPYDETGKLTVRTCLNCFACYPSTMSACPQCGAAYVSTKDEIKNIKSIKLEEIKQGRRESAMNRIGQSMDIKKCRTLQEFQAYAKLKGYKPGFAYVMWKNRMSKKIDKHCTDVVQ